MGTDGESDKKAYSRKTVPAGLGEEDSVPSPVNQPKTTPATASGTDSKSSKENNPKSETDKDTKPKEPSGATSGPDTSNLTYLQYPDFLKKE